MSIDQQFVSLIQNILYHGKTINTRNSKVLRLINPQKLVFNSTPLVSVRRTAVKNCLREMEWFLSGSNNISDLHDSVKKWWEPWADEDGYIENNYSQQFRQFWGAFDSVDQVEYVVNTLKNHPNSRRNVITTWNTAEMISPETPITNCHGTIIQTFVEPDDTVHLTTYQRSSDVVLGLPHNLLQYWAFLQYISHKSGRKVGSITYYLGDAHIYDDHIDMANRLTNLTNLDKIETPQLVYSPTSEDFKADDFSLDKEYKPLIKENLKMTV